MDLGFGISGSAPKMSERKPAQTATTKSRVVSKPGAKSSSLKDRKPRVDTKKDLGFAGKPVVAKKQPAATAPVAERTPTKPPARARPVVQSKVAQQISALPFQRAKVWSVEAENMWRVQQAGWKDEEEYEKTHGELLRHKEPPHFISETRTKKNGFWMYWRRYRELEDKYLRQVKMPISKPQ